MPTPVPLSDTFEVRPGTSSAVADTPATQSDPLVALLDSIVAQPDPVAAPPDAVAARPDAVAAPSDAVASPEGRPRPAELAVGLGFRPGTSSERLLLALLDSIVAQPDPVAAPPDAVAALPDPMAAPSDAVASPERQPRPAELAVGLGFRPGTSSERLLIALREVLGDKPIACLATIDRRAGERGLRVAASRLGVPVRTYTAAELAQVDVPNPSARTDDALGTASVAEAAALLAAGGPLVIPKRTVDGIVIAAALIPLAESPAAQRKSGTEFDRQRQRADGEK